MIRFDTGQCALPVCSPLRSSVTAGVVTGDIGAAVNVPVEDTGEQCTLDGAIITPFAALVAVFAVLLVVFGASSSGMSRVCVSLPKISRNRFIGSPIPPFPTPSQTPVVPVAALVTVSPYIVPPVAGFASDQWTLIRRISSPQSSRPTVSVGSVRTPRSAVGCSITDCSVCWWG